MQNTKTESRHIGNGVTYTKRIHTTNYIVGVHFATTSGESVSDKVLRLIKNDVSKH